MLNTSENSNQCPPTIENLSNDEPQVLWVGIVICVLSLILLLPRLGSVISALNSHFGLLFIYEAPIIGGLLIFLSIGAYMISCSVRKKVANPPIKASFTKAKSAALLLLLVFGLTLIVVAVSQIASDPMNPSETKIAIGAGGTITLVSMAWVFLMFRRMELFRGRKSRLFWWGLGIFGAAFWGLFAFLWAAFVSIYSFVFSADFVVQMLGSTSLMAVAYFMMREAAKLKAAIPQLSNQLPKASPVFRFEKVKMPKGVGVIAVLNMISAFIFGYLFMMLYILTMLGYYGVPYLINARLILAATLFLGIVSIITSVAMLKNIRSKVLWYAMMIFWSALLAYSATLHLNFWLSFSSYMSWLVNSLYLVGIYAAILAPFVYAFTCMGYFLTWRIRVYYHVSEPATLQNASISSQSITRCPTPPP